MLLDIPLIFGDFRGYTIVDRVGTQLSRFEESSQWKAGVVEFAGRRRLGGQVTDRNAMKYLCTKA